MDSVAIRSKIVTEAESVGRCTITDQEFRTAFRNLHDAERFASDWQFGVQEVENGWLFAPGRDRK